MRFIFFISAATINAEKEREEQKYFESLINSVSQNETADIQLSPVERVLQSEYTTSSLLSLVNQDWTIKKKCILLYPLMACCGFYTSELNQGL